MCDLLHQTQAALLLARSDNGKLRELVKELIESRAFILRYVSGYSEEMDIYLMKAKELGVYE